MSKKQQKKGLILGPVFKDFGTSFGSKTSQNKLPKRSKRANIAISSNFENMHFLLFFTVFLEHQTSQTTPKIAQKPPKMAPDSLQEPLKKKVSFWIDFLAKMDPKMAPKVGQKNAKNWSKKCVKQKKI